MPSGGVVGPYPYDVVDVDGVQQWGLHEHSLTSHCELRLAPLLAGILLDLEAGVPTPVIAWGFHLTMTQMVVDTCSRLRERTGLTRVALSGGCFQNRLLLELVVPRLDGAGFEVLTHRQVPCNDGGVALGQAAIAHYRMNGD